MLFWAGAGGSSRFATGSVNPHWTASGVFCQGQLKTCHCSIQVRVVRGRAMGPRAFVMEL